jgi:hypothetical protein
VRINCWTPMFTLGLSYPWFNIVTNQWGRNKVNSWKWSVIRATPQELCDVLWGSYFLIDRRYGSRCRPGSLGAQVAPCRVNDNLWGAVVLKRVLLYTG